MATPPEKVIPNCRYEHGPLQLQPVGVNQKFCAVEYPLESIGAGPFKVWSFNVYKCPICTYLELHDYE